MKLLVIDGTNLLFRGYFASAKLNMNNGTKMTGAVYLSLNIISNIKNLIGFENGVDKMIFAFDNKTSKQNRKSIFQHYKSNRDHSKNGGIFEQIDDFKKLVEFSEHALFDEEGLEADDVCGIIVKEYEDREDIEHIYVYSSDKDFMQFLSPKTTLIRSSNGGMLDFYDYLQFFEDYEMTKEQFIEYKALLGDSTDYVIGISKLGGKGVETILREYGEIENWFKDKEGYNYLPKWVRQEVEENEDKHWKDVEIEWLEVEGENGEKEIVKETIENIFKTNKLLVSINYDLEGISDEGVKTFKKKLKKAIYSKEREQDRIQALLDELKIKTNTI